MAESNRESCAETTLSAEVPHELVGSEVTYASAILLEAPQSVVNDPMELDSDPRTLAHSHTEKECVFDAEDKAKDNSAIVQNHPGPRRPAKLPLEIITQDDPSPHKPLKDRLLEDALDDKKVLKKNIADAEERTASAVRRAEAAETQLAAARAQILPKRSTERDHELARYRDNEKIYLKNEKIYQNNERISKGVEKQLKQTQAALEVLRRKEGEAQEGVVHWKGETQHWTSKANQYEADIKQIQEKSLREMTDGRWNPIPDKDIRDRLYVLYQDVRDWAKTWAATSVKLESMPEESRKTFVQTFLSEFVRLDSSGGLPAEIGSPSAKMKDKIPWLLLSSALSCEIEHQFFRNSFFCADAKHVDSLSDTYELLVKASPREGHIWRSMMWRILNPPAAGRDPQNQAVSNKTQHRVLILCEKVDADFKKGPAKWLLRSGESDGAKKVRAKALRDILMKAAGIATLIWVQRSYLECVALDTFKSRNDTFDVQSPIMQSHALNKVDTEDPSNNGRRILLVARPAVLAFDEDDTKGLNGEKYRVLAPAIVFLEDAPVPARGFFGF